MIDENPFLIFSPSKISIASTAYKDVILHLLALIFFDYFAIVFDCKYTLAIGALNRLFGLINPPDCTILNNWISQTFILADEPFAKALQFFKKLFETCVLLINNNFCEKLFSSIEISIKPDERFTVALVPFFIASY